MSPPLAQSLALLVATWVAWRVLRRLVAKDPFATIPGPPSASRLAGNMMDIINPETAAEYLDGLTKTYGGVFRCYGLFNADSLYVYDPKALYQIIVKDQHIFEESGDFLRTNATILGKQLTGTVGDHHRKQRKMLNPVFSIAHMREMTPIFYSIGRKLRESIGQQVSNDGNEIDLLPWMTRSALELIGQSGFGYSFDNLDVGGEEHAFARSAKNINGTLADPLISMVRILVWPLVYGWGSPAFQRTVVDWLPWKKLHELRDMTDVVNKTAIEVFESTKRSLKEGRDISTRAGGGKDIMTVLLKANMSASEEDRLPEDELIAQISGMTFAGMETTSNALSRILHLLSEHPEVQEKLRKEVRDAYASHDGDLDYDTLTALPLLDAVCRESLRLYAPLPLLLREAREDGILPLFRPITSTSGQEIREVFVPKGTTLFISLHHCNRNPEIWGLDAAEWKPERWLEPLPDTVAEAKVPGVYSNLMTFLGGSRACIGFKFAQLEMKVVLSLLLERFQFAPGEKEIVWLNNGIVQPSTKDAPLSSTGRKELGMPLKVSVAP
ncbi:cytochrome P450 [Ephemerocybe angulata]|uniref:Cytochrome P450 n=1 Tax=Ephemerocybe angulata TaxID=980116 RepID=A0A8H6M4N1_9AGAR|nr:cytochrome P450 [Tulosesus angulatus]